MKIIDKLKRLRIDIYFAPEPIIIKDYTFEEAYNLIKIYFQDKNHDKVYPSKISEDLGISYELVWKVLKAMEQLGVIKS